MDQKRSGQLSMSTAGTSRTRNSQRSCQIHRTFNNIKITILCGFVTILVLCGYIGINLRTSEADAINQSLIEETNWILAEIRSDNDPDELIEPEYFNPNFTYILGPKIKNWDQERKNWLDRNPEFPNYVAGKARVLLVSGSPPNPWYNPIGDHYLLKAIKIKIDYYRLHGIETAYWRLFWTKSSPDTGKNCC